MRRLLVMVTALSLCGAMIGCRHTAGMCDCNSGGYSYGTPTGGFAPPSVAVESLPAREMPRAEPTSITPGNPVSIGVHGIGTN
jgi:hypothetical protein